MKTVKVTLKFEVTLEVEDNEIDLADMLADLAVEQLANSLGEMARERPADEQLMQVLSSWDDIELEEV